MAQMNDADKRRFAKLTDLIGGRIIGVEAGPVPYSDDMFFCLKIFTPEDEIKRFWILADDEGNAPGSFTIA